MQSISQSQIFISFMIWTILCVSIYSWNMKFKKDEFHYFKSSYSPKPIYIKVTIIHNFWTISRYHSVRRVTLEKTHFWQNSILLINIIEWYNDSCAGNIILALDDFFPFQDSISMNSKSEELLTLHCLRPFFAICCFKHTNNGI